MLFLAGWLFFSLVVFGVMLAVAADAKYCEAYADAVMTSQFRTRLWSWCLNQDEPPPMPIAPQIDTERCARDYRSWRASDQTVLRYANPTVRVPCPLQR